MQVDDIGAHTVQEVLRVGYEYKDSLEPENNKQDELYISIVWTHIKQWSRIWTYDLSSSSNHTQASRSKWLVGSSSNSMKGLMKRALNK